MDAYLLTLVAFLGYLLGSVPTGVLLSRLFGWPDPRLYGSRHIGAMNSYRVGGMQAMILVLFGDALKGIAAVVMAEAITLNVWAIPIAGTAAVAGHNWPVWLGFKGGMGLSTGAAAMAVQFFPAVLVAAAWWGLLRLILRHTPRSTVVAAILAPITLLVLPLNDLTLPTIVLAIGVCILVGVRPLTDLKRD
ncbi:MAG: glycerol-3-phosphate acyltransferase [Chloroflexi bacterium]|nr:glycerol-3-phosphate acyltransferase [Chloroflexota bacterium]